MANISVGANTGFVLDPRLEADSVLLGRLSTCQVRLMKDARWVWLLLVPEIPEAQELGDLPEPTYMKVMGDQRLVAKMLKQITHCEKINIGTLGNIVRQLHIHIIARNNGDANWPGPVWGFGEREDYDANEMQQLSATIKNALKI